MVLPHFNAFGGAWLPSAVDGAPRDDIVLLGIDERSAAVWHGGLWHASGPGSVTVVAGGATRRFDSGAAIDGVPSPSVPETEQP